MLCFPFSPPLRLQLQKKNKEVEVPLQCFMAPNMTPGDSCRKPATGMWDYMVEHCNDGIQPGGQGVWSPQLEPCCICALHMACDGKLTSEGNDGHNANGGIPTGLWVSLWV